MSEYDARSWQAAYLIAFLLGDALWRWTVGVAGGAAALQALMAACVLEESPRWLDSIHTKERRAGRATALLACHWREFTIASGLALAHGATGANAVLYYSRDVLQRAGFSQPLALSLGVGFVKFLGALTSICLVDQQGRRPLLLGGTAIMCAGHVGLSLSFWALPTPGVLALGSLLLFIFAWNVSWAGLMLTVASELLPQQVRGIGVGLIYALYWLLSFCISQTLESTLQSLGEGVTFAAFGAMTAVAFCFVWKYVPETNGVGLA
mgnify:CR=1 FL=1|jgi:hypothetical protein